MKPCSKTLFSTLDLTERKGKIPVGNVLMSLEISIFLSKTKVNDVNLQKEKNINFIEADTIIIYT